MVKEADLSSAAKAHGFDPHPPQDSIVRCENESSNSNFVAIRYSLMVRIAPFHGADPGSIPGIGKIAHHLLVKVRGSIAQLVEREAVNLKVMGSNPIRTE